MFDRVFDRGHPETQPERVVKRRKPRRGRGSRRWAYLDLNQGPHPYQGCALTRLSYRPVRDGQGYQPGLSTGRVRPAHGDAVSVPVPGVLDGPRLGGVINMNEAEPLSEPAYPLKVVEETPYEVPIDGDSLCAELLDLRDV